MKRKEWGNRRELGDERERGEEKNTGVQVGIELKTITCETEHKLSQAHISRLTVVMFQSC